MARPYTNRDTVLFSQQMCRPGAGFSGFIGTGFRCPPDLEPDAGYPKPIVVLRSWYWLDEGSGLLGQTNVSSKQLRAEFLPREGEPRHFEKRFKWSWPHVTPARMKDTVRVLREAEGTAPDTFSQYAATVGAYVFGAGPDGGFNGYLGLPGATAEAAARLPQGAVPPRSQPWALELFIKDGNGGRWACIPEYSTATGSLTAINLLKEQHTDADPATPLVLEKLRPRVAPPRPPLPADAAAWRRAGSGSDGSEPGSSIRTFVDPVEGLVMTEEGLESHWSPPEVPSGHSLHRLPDATYLLCPDNIHSFGGPVTFELGARRLGGSTGDGMQRVVLRFDADGVWQEVRYELYE
ncbi:hypothetical protein GPECTOR_296g797 [Gonium pectorale]|uniref:DUF3598 domain-containing protein n=1 Tax=Gonium pectorale TaxID=33097 RepID=A0A150FVY3_GONPE|nr:hypothetical protein GPECTOR_296g797 [Gonium pectorale]|eukprot:KXZ41747.1 hypothetical protein GPECTOR_296g797 [Gonium pectorale]